MSAYAAAVKKHFPFSKEEWQAFIILSLFWGFIAAFDQWGDDRFDALTGLLNLAVGIALCALSLFVHHAAQRLYAIRKGFKVTNGLWTANMWPLGSVPVGPVLGFLLVFVSRGNIKFLGGSSTDIEPLGGSHRLGRGKFPFTLKTLGRACLAGVLANALLAGLAAWLWNVGFPDSIMLERLVAINLIMTIVNILPLPPLDGSRIIFLSRPLYVFGGTAALAYAILAAFGSPGLWWLALLVGFISWFLFDYFFETQWA